MWGVGVWKQEERKGRDCATEGDEGVDVGGESGRAEDVSRKH